MPVGCPDFVAADMVKWQRARWRVKMLSNGRDFAVFLRQSVFSKCQRARFCRKIAAVGGHSTCPPAAHQEINMDLPLIRKTGGGNTVSLQALTAFRESNIREGRYKVTSRKNKEEDDLKVKVILLLRFALSGGGS